MAVPVALNLRVDADTRRRARGYERLVRPFPPCETLISHLSAIESEQPRPWISSSPTAPHSFSCSRSTEQDMNEHGRFASSDPWEGQRRVPTLIMMNIGVCPSRKDASVGV